MNQKHLWVTSVALAVLCACGAREGNGTGDDTQGVGEGAQRGAEGTEQAQATNESEEAAEVQAEADVQAEGEESNTVASASEQNAYVGTWRQQGAASDAEMFIVLEADRGAMCGADGKSQAQFDLVHTGSALSMGSYAYGGGDELEVIDGEVLQRSAEEKGVTYVVTYERWDEELPTWCQEQLAELK
jgi:hypothetical protein